MLRPSIEDRAYLTGQPSRALHLFALVQVAVAYPAFDLLRIYPEFFVARQSQPVDFLALVAVVCLLLPLFLFGLQWLVSRLAPRLGRFMYLAFLLALFVCLGLSLFASAGSALFHAMLGLGFGLLLTLAYLRSGIARLFVSFLAPAILVVPAMFLADDSIRPLLEREPAVVAAAPAGSAGGTPIVFLVFDELPTLALLDDSGRIDPDLFPNFHALAETAHWFPNATTVATSTVLAITPMLNGRYPDGYRLPYDGEFPDTLFTWLGEDYDLNVSEAVSSLCPGRLCGGERLAPAKQRIGGLLLDITAVWLSRVVPELPGWGRPIVNKSWKNFWGNASGVPVMYEHRMQQLDEFVAKIHRTDRPGLEFIHVNFPHIPYEYLPSGRRYQEGWLIPGLDFSTDRWSGSPGQSSAAYRRFLMQLRALDGWLGRLIGKLRREGLFDEAVIVVTADHGASFTPGAARRDVPDIDNLERNIMPVPLIVKTPFQQESRVSRRNAETVDILPTLAEILERPVPWEMDGVSLLRASKPGPKRIWHLNREMAEHHVANNRIDEIIQTPAASRDWLTNEIPHETESGLLGTDPADLDVRLDPGLSVRVDHEGYFESVEPGGDFLPAHLTAVLEGTVRDSSLAAVALNSTIVALTRVFNESGNARVAVMLPEERFLQGGNSVRVYLVEGGDGQTFSLRAATPPEREAWSLVAARLHDGPTELRADTDGTRGGLDYISSTSASSEIMGWAVDVAGMGQVRSILVFEGDRLVYQGTTPMFRDEMHRFGLSATLGFHAVIPSHLVDGGERLRVFAVTGDGRYRELEVNTPPDA